MKIDIFYFSGTGNSLWLAKKISEKLEDSKLISIPVVIKQEMKIKGEIIGIVCPIYMYNIPLLVADFIRMIERADYIFMVYAGAGHLGGGIKDTMKIFDSQKLKLNSLFNVPLPSNYTPYGVTPKDKQKEMFDSVDSKVADIVETVKSHGSFMDSANTSFYNTYIHPGILYRLGYRRINMLDEAFTTDEKCNGCSICQKVCPVNNITMKANRPVWNHQCQQCYACLQWCPTESIQAGRNTVGIERYHNPYISVKDIINASAP